MDFSYSELLRQLEEVAAGACDVLGHAGVICAPRGMMTGGRDMCPG